MQTRLILTIKNYVLIEIEKEIDVMEMIYALNSRFNFEENFTNNYFVINNAFF